uniref:Uncharacterized protein n=1 Tax=Solanum lycopersicum TaxID=4081 RepID=K4D227_SOLLC
MEYFLSEVWYDLLRAIKYFFLFLKFGHT